MYIVFPSTKYRNNDITPLLYSKQSFYSKFSSGMLELGLFCFQSFHHMFVSGDLMNENEVLEWLIEQKTTSTIEEVTEEILQELIEDNEYVVVYFSKYLLNSINFLVAISKFAELLLGIGCLVVFLILTVVFSGYIL